MATYSKNRSGNWEVRIRRKGWPQQTATFPTKKKAEEWAHRTESELSTGHYVDRTLGQRTTLKELIELYLKEVTDKRPGEASRVAERSRLERFMREEKDLCAHAVANLKPEQFEDYRDRRLAQPSGEGKTIAPGTVKRELTLLKRVIDHRRRRLGLTINPVNPEDVARPAVNDERDVRLSRSPDKIIDHTVALSPRAIEILTTLPRSVDGRVFPMTANAFRLGFNRARKKAGLEHFRFHDTRHERVSSLFEAGWSDTAVMAMSGHRDPKSLKRYANLRTSHLADELAKLGRGAQQKGQA